MRAVAIVDVGSDSTETLVFVPTAEGPREVARRRKITSLGTRVHATGRLERAAIGRVLAALDAHDELAHEHGCTATRALLTSAVRDASDGHELEALLGARGYEVTVLTE